MGDSQRSYADIIRGFYLVFQPIVLVDQSLQAHIEDYEVLLRGRQTHMFPYRDFEYIIETNEGNSALLQWFQRELRRACDCLPELKIDINLDPQQLLFQSTVDFLVNLKDLADQINIEITEAPSQIVSLTNDKITAALQKIIALGFSATLDDVDTGGNNLPLVKQNAKYISRIKLSLIAFDGKPAAELAVLLQKWQTFAKNYHLQLIVEGIEDSSLATSLENSKFDLQQGFYWARPKIFDCLCKGR